MKDATKNLNGFKHGGIRAAASGKNYKGLDTFIPRGLQ
jgi:hypothetical protein